MQFPQPGLDEGEELEFGLPIVGGKLLAVGVQVISELFERGHGGAALAA